MILISDKFDEQMPKALARFGEVTTDQKRAPEAEIILVRSKTKCTKEYIDATPKCKLIIRGGVGLDNIDVPYAQSKGIIVKNTGEASTIAVAEMAFAMMIALPNHIAKADASMREGRWLKAELERSELYGKTLGILGMGRIGTALAVRAKAFKMEVLAWHPDVFFSDFAEIVESIEDVVGKSDFVSMHMPKLPDTKGLVNNSLLGTLFNGLTVTAGGSIATTVPRWSMIAVAPVLVARIIGRWNSSARRREMFRCWTVATVSPNQPMLLRLARTVGAVAGLAKRRASSSPNKSS